MRKSGRRATKQEKILMVKDGLNHEEYHVVHNTNKELLVKHKENGSFKTIKKAH
jgi:hypothetical protein